MLKAQEVESPKAKIQEFQTQESKISENKQSNIQRSKSQAKDLEAQVDSKDISESAPSSSSSLQSNNLAGQERKWLGWAFGALGLRGVGFVGESSALMVYATLGLKYNLSKGAIFGVAKGLNIALPIGFGAMSVEAKHSRFALPIAVEMRYLFEELPLGLSGGLRYTFSPQSFGDLHLLDLYLGLEIAYSVFMEVGYVFYSNQISSQVKSLNGAVGVNFGLRF